MLSIAHIGNKYEIKTLKLTVCRGSGRLKKEMAEKGNVIPDCPNASNPYHECTEACLRKISHGETRKDKKKSGNCLYLEVCS